MIKIMTGENGGLNELTIHEKEILRRSKCVALLPHTIREKEDKFEIYYDTNGFVSIKSYPYRDVKQIFRTVRTVVQGIRSVQDCLLSPHGVLRGADRVFIRNNLGDALLIYAGTSGHEQREERDAVRYLLKPLIAEFASKNQVPYAKESMAELLEKLSFGVPGYRNIIREIDDIELRLNDDEKLRIAIGF
jgi:hypothetical protein